MESWIIRDAIPEAVNKNLSMYPLFLRELLYARGIETGDEAHIFLNPDYERDIHDPFKLLGMERAVERIWQALKQNERIVIYADYDADGIPGSVVMHDFLTRIGYENFEVYIPHRYDEGYGLNTPAIENFKKQGAGLIVTIDCGITNNAEVARANELGIDVIVTDHHLPGKELPKAYALVNPNQDGDTYPFPHLSGGGLAFKLVQGLIKKGVSSSDWQDGWEKWSLDVAGISTMSDMVPLRGENRALAFFGLRVLKKMRRAGLQKLFQKKRVRAHELTEDDVGFVITPHINAASRMATPRDAFRLLSTNDMMDAMNIVRFLSEKNDERKRVVEDILKEVDDILARGEPASLISLGAHGWKPGVLGLAANRVMEKYKRPVCLWGGTGSGVVRGSCRSDGTVNIVDLMKKVPEEYFLDSGGHEYSGGFSAEKENAEHLSGLFVSIYEELKEVGARKETALVVDKKLSLDEVTWETYDLVRSLAPFGIENRKPVFLFESVVIEKALLFGKTKNHLKLIFQKKNGELMEAIRFFSGLEVDGIARLEPGMALDVAAHLERDTFSGTPSLRLRILKLLPGKAEHV